MAADIVTPSPQFSPARRYHRYRLDIPVRVVATKGNKVVVVQGRGNELNQGGMLIFAGLELKVGEQIAVEFTPAYSGVPVRVRCSVRDRNEYKYGTEFLMETPEDLESAEHIRSMLQAYGVPIR